MREKTFQKGMRLLLGALLNSNLTAQELREISIELRNGPLGHEVGRTLSNFVDEYTFHVRAVYDSPRIRKITEPGSSISEAIHLIQQRKLSRENLLRMMRRISDGSYVPSPSARKSSTRSLLETFESKVGRSLFIKFLDELRGPGQVDPYLKGIGNR